MTTFVSINKSDFVSAHGSDFFSDRFLSFWQALTLHINLKFENLVLWARSEIIGSACNSFKEWWSIGVLEWWSIAREFYASENPNDRCLKLQKIGVGFCFSNTPLLQHSISMLNRAELWRAPFQGANQSQALWAWILYSLCRRIQVADILSVFLYGTFPPAIWNLYALHSHIIRHDPNIDTSLSTW
jgi:hypothetical protein